MAFLQGTCKRFANTVITLDEIIGAGTGSQTVFNYTVLNPPVFLNSLTINYTVGSTPFVATSDSAGNITGTHISSGSVNANGDITITFSTAPDASTNVVLDQYTTKGFLQQLIDFCVPTIYNENYGTGDDIQTTFNKTLANTTIAKGQLLLRFKISGVIYDVWDNGTGEWEHSEISTSSIDYATGITSVTFNNPVDDTFIILAIYNTGAPGQDWHIFLEQNSKDNADLDAFPGLLLKEIVIKNCGISFKEFNCVGLREYQRVAGNVYGLNFNLYRQFGEAEESDGKWLANPGDIGLTYDGSSEVWFMPKTPLGDEAMSFEITSTKRRIIANIMIGTIQETFYIGQGIRLSSPSDYNQPGIIIGTTNTAIAFTSTASQRYIIDPLQGSSGTRQVSFIATNGVQKFGQIKTIPTDNFLNLVGILKKTTNNKVPKYPVYIEDIETDEVIMQLDGCYHCPNNGIQALDILDDPVNPDLTVAQNIDRTDYFEFMAIRRE